MTDLYHDTTLTDEAWLLSVGFEATERLLGLPPDYRLRFRPGDDMFSYLLIHPPPREHPDWGYKATVGGGGCWPGSVATRGLVRLLAGALGRELEPAA